MRGRISVSWEPEEWEEEIAVLEEEGLGSRCRVIDKVNEGLRVFHPLEAALYDRQRQTDSRLLESSRLKGCELILKKEPEPVSYEVGRYLCADVRFDVLDLLRLPIDNLIAGPIAYDVFLKASTLYSAAYDFSAKTMKEVLLEFKQNGYVHKWILKDTSLRKYDFRLKIHVLESSERTVSILEISSLEKKISERLEIYNAARSHPINYDPFGKIANFNPNADILLKDLSKVKIDKKGIHIAPTFDTQITSEAVAVDSEYVTTDAKYRITIGRDMLSSTVCDILGIVDVR